MKTANRNLRRAIFLVVLTATISTTVVENNADANPEIYRQTLKSTTWVVAKVEKGLSRGSGVLIDKQRRLVLTNYHVVQNARDALVFFPYRKGESVVAERPFYIKNVKKLGIKSKVIAIDRKRDLALIQLPAVADEIPAISLAESSAGPGEVVHSLGNPGTTEALWVYTSGKVRAVYRKQFTTNVGEHHFKVLETTAPINAGDSGGPVVNDSGKLVGISQSVSLRARLVTYCVDITEIKSFLSGSWKPAPLPVATVLTAAGLQHKRLENGPFSVEIETDGKKRQVFTSGDSEYFQKAEVRKVWSLAGTLEKTPAADFMLKLLAQNAKTKMGAWTLEKNKDGRFLVLFVAKVDATATPEALRSSIEYVGQITQKMATELVPVKTAKEKESTLSNWLTGL